MSSSRRNQGTAWSKWELDEQNNRYFRARRNHRGEWEYDYSYPPGIAEQAPRGDGVDDLVSSISDVAISDTSYNLDTPGVQDDSGYDDSYTFSAPPGSAGFGMSDVSPSSGQNVAYEDQTRGYGAPPAQVYDDYNSRAKGNYYTQPSGHKQPKGKGSSSRRPRHRGKPQQDLPPPSPGSFGPGEPFYEQKLKSDMSSVASSYDGSSSVASEYEQEVPNGTDAVMLNDQVPDDTQSEYSSAANITTLNPAALVFSEPGPIGTENEAIEDTATVVEATDEYFTVAAGYEEDGGYATGTVAGPSSIATGYDQPAYQFQDDPGQHTPRALSPLAQNPYPYVSMDQRFEDRGYGAGPSGDQSDMWSRYVVEPSSRFQPGEVFKIWWAEPLGNGMNATLRSYMQRGKKFHESFRRFIVVANDEGHCTCVPILTYSHQACTKRGVKPHKHGIVYASNSRPRMLPGEPDLGFEPVRLDLTERAEKLDKESRVNYAKLVTIEHNYRVFFIGRIAPSDFHNIVTPAVDYCWLHKNRQHR